MAPCLETSRAAIGWWTPNGTPPITETDAFEGALQALREPVYVLRHGAGIALGLGGSAALGGTGEGLPIVAFAPALRLEDLGDPAFCSDHRIRFPCAAGAMANGIGSVEIVSAMARGGFLGFFGSAGLAIEVVAAAVARLKRDLGHMSWGVNFIHSPAEPALEDALCDLYIREGVRLVEASAFLGLTLPIVRYRLHGVRRGPGGEIIAPNRIVAKVSRVEVAAQFFSPPPEKFLRELVARGELTEETAKLAERLPVAQDLTVEADSGGHTDNRPLVALLPTMLAVRDRLQERYAYASPLRVGAAGGIATPDSAAAAFAMGAAYVVTGTINQSCIEAGTSDAVRDMLSSAEQADVAMAPAADMFEMGVKVQVLKRGTMFAMRAAKLYEAYRKYDSMEAIPPAERAQLESQLFRAPLEEIWEQTRAFFERRDPAQNARAERDPRHKLALVCRWYLGHASRWANAGEPSRRVDYQVWCGPAMGAFNEWAKGSSLEDWRNRKIAVLAANILYGAAVRQRLNILRSQGARIGPEAVRMRPQDPARLEEFLAL